MVISRENTVIRDQEHLMNAEGASDIEPTENAIRRLLVEELWCASEIEIWFDTMQGFWRWSCNITPC